MSTGSGTSEKKTSMQLAGFLIVALTMVEMFTIPKTYFVLGSIVSTSAMALVAYLIAPHALKGLRFSGTKIAFGVITAILLYGLFFIGNLGVRNLNLPGIQPTNEQTIYGLFSNVPLPLLIVVLVLDAIGFEYYFRGNLQQVFARRIGIGAVFLVAVVDAAIHISTLNPLFPATVIVADSIWGLNYYFTKDLYSNIASHFLWDMLIFVVFPIH